MSDENEIVGHKTFSDGHGGFRHEPLTKAEGDALWAAAEANEAKRAALYPTAEDAVRGMWEAWYRLKELGWQEARYAPPDRELKRVVEIGSAGIHEAYCEPRPLTPLRGDDKWWWSPSHGDLWPMSPILYLPDVKSRG